MKRIYTYITVLFFLGLFIPGRLFAGIPESDDSYIRRMNIVPGEMTMNDRRMNVEVFFAWDRLPVKTQHSVNIIPAIVSDDGFNEVVLDTIHIEGNVRELVGERKSLYDNKKSVPHDYVVSFNGKSLKSTDGYHYQTAVPYERWMLDSHIEVREEVYGCRDCGRWKDTLSLDGSLLEEYIPVWKSDITGLTSDRLNDKSLSSQYDAILDFRINSYSIDERYGNNRELLKNIVSSIDDVEKKGPYTIEAINIKGYVSPDGPLNKNRVLSERRAESLYKKLHSKLSSKPGIKWNVTGEGEDWDSFIKAVKSHPELGENEKLLEIIESYDGTNADEVEKEMRNLRKSFKKMAEDIFPPLRRIHYEVIYCARPYTGHEALEVYAEHPEWISMAEFFSAAECVEKDSDAYSDIIIAAAKKYPGEALPVNLAAEQLIKREKYDEALDLLKDMTDSVSINTRGYIYALQKRYDLAEECFRESASSGNSSASSNLETLERVKSQL